MNLSLDQTLIEVWRQALVENAKQVILGAKTYPVRKTAKRGLRQVDFEFEGEEFRGLEQNPDTASRWAQMARSGNRVSGFALANPESHKVMQFLSHGRYIANVADGKLTLYSGSKRKS